MIDTRTERTFRIVLYGVVAIAAAAYGAFIYGYPTIFPYIQQADPLHYRQAVESARTAGDFKSALRSANIAASRYRLDVEAQTLYGELLLDSGDAAQARQQFEKAVAITTTPAPESRRTKLPYFYPRARLALGELDWKKGDSMSALTQFELAQPLAALDDPALERYHPAAAEAYAQAHVWSRALEYRSPAPEILAPLDRENLLMLINAAEGAEAWAVLAQTGRALLAKDTGDPAGHYAVGRSMIANSDYADAIEPLRNAADNGHHDAGYFLGVAYAANGDPYAAVDAYRQTPDDSLYRLFALAAALALLDTNADAADADDVLDELNLVAAGCCPITLDQSPALLGVTHAVPRSIRFATPRIAASKMLVLVRWQSSTSAKPAPVSPRLVTGPHGQRTLTLGSDIFLLEWAANHLPLGDFDRLGLGMRQPPGWVDPAVVWAKTRELSAGLVEPSPLEPGQVLSVTSASPDQRALLYSIPVPLRPGSIYAIAARMHAPDTKAVFGWQFLGDREQRVAGSNAVNQRPVRQWRWRTAVTQAHYSWKFAQVVLGVYEASGTALFDDVFLLEFTTPAP